MSESTQKCADDCNCDDSGLADVSSFKAQPHVLEARRRRAEEARARARAEYDAINGGRPKPTGVSLPIGPNGKAPPIGRPIDRRRFRRALIAIHGMGFIHYARRAAFVWIIKVDELLWTIRGGFVTQEEEVARTEVCRSCPVRAEKDGWLFCKPCGCGSHFLARLGMVDPDWDGGGKRWYVSLFKNRWKRHNCPYGKHEGSAIDPVLLKSGGCGGQGR